MADLSDDVLYELQNLITRALDPEWPNSWCDELTRSWRLKQLAAAIAELKRRRAEGNH